MESPDDASCKWRSVVGYDDGSPFSASRRSQGQRMSRGGGAVAFNGFPPEARAALRGQCPSAALVAHATGAVVGPNSGAHKIGLAESSEKRLAALTEQLRLGMSLSGGSASAGRPGSGQDDGDRARAECRPALGNDAVDQRPAANGHAAEHHARPRAETVGECSVCHKHIRSKIEACTAMGRNYHIRCFTCFTCGRTLKGKPFYWLQDKAYCEEDYKYTGFQQMAEHCRACGQLILDVVLQAVGQPYHPGCFRCEACNRCLDGEPFTLDATGSVPLCIADYHRLYAPVCASCKGAILPLQGTDETVRVVALDRDYHVDCYHCADCGVQLTDEPEQRCYPLDDALLCRRCHVVRRQQREPHSGSEADTSGGAPHPSLPALRLGAAADDGCDVAPSGVRSRLTGL